jgi:sulfur carrier protein
MIVMVNDRKVEVDEQTTIAGLLESLGFPDRGIAVAIDFAVLPRSDWATKLSELSGLSDLSGAPVRLEVVTAVQGG